MPFYSTASKAPQPGSAQVGGRPIRFQGDGYLHVLPCVDRRTRDIADGRIDKGNAATDLTRQAAGMPKRTACERSREWMLMTWPTQCRAVESTRQAVGCSDRLALWI